jgi:hypothetical protein
MYYNFARHHKPLAMAAGFASHIWTVEEIVRLIDQNKPD